MTRTTTFALAASALAATVDDNGVVTACPLNDEVLRTFDGRVRNWMLMAEGDLVACLQDYRSLYLQALDAGDSEVAGIFYDFKEWAHAALYTRFGFTI
jgi:hypothetical protein